MYPHVSTTRQHTLERIRVIARVIEMVKADLGSFALGLSVARGCMSLMFPSDEDLIVGPAFSG